MAINDFMDRAVSAIQQYHSFHEALSSKLVPLKIQGAPDSVENVVVPVKRIQLSAVVAGVDSGFVPKKLAFLDLLLIKAAGVVFEYREGLLQNSAYLPRVVSFPEPIMLRSSLENDEVGQSTSLERLRKEVSLSIEVIEKFKPKYFFIDGSIVPQYQDKPRKESEINADYHSIVECFQSLYSAAEKNSCTLISCVEDSRGSRFNQIMREEILPKSKISVSRGTLEKTFDSVFLDYFLNEGERTFAFPYTKNTDNHAILKDYSKQWSESIFVFYLKASAHDKPLRVEFICKKNSGDGLKKCADEISETVFSLSCLHKEYVYPSILIEADLRARLTPNEINIIYEKLIDKVGTKVMLRRNARPFG
ncbi:MAG: DNA double-strand break repair nuclease NurA [archaeon]|jgi:hypothetical protein